MFPQGKILSLGANPRRWPWVIWVSRWGFSWCLVWKLRGDSRYLEVLPPAISVYTLQACIYSQGKGWESADSSWGADVSPGEDE